MTSTNWQKLRTFNYRDLRFLYIACLVAIAVIYSVFRGTQFYLNEQEGLTLRNIQRLETQAESVNSLQRLVAGPESPLTVKRAAEIYAEIVSRHPTLTAPMGELSARCRQNPCAGLFRTDYFTIPVTEVAAEKQGFSRLGELLEPYHAALTDAIERSLTISSLRNHQDLAVDLIGYFALIGVLIFQAIYIFRPAIQRLNASLATRSEFMSRISHEIRNPMNSIIGMADILKGTRLSFEQQQYVENLMRSGNALLDMLDGLLDFSVIESGRMVLNVANFDLFQSLAHCLTLVATPANHKNLNLYLNVDPRVPAHLMGDSTRLGQVLLNLIGNAVKFTEHGQVTLDVTWNSEDEQDVFLTFSVQDSGIGIKPEQRSEIFDSFVQGDSSIQRKYGGSGLGLSIAREIVRLMGGTLDLQSTLGEGSTFFFTLPLTKQKSRDKGPSSLAHLKEIHLIFLVAEGEAEIYRTIFERLQLPVHVLSSTTALREALPLAGRVDEILIDDSVGIISMINCRNLSDQFGLHEKTVALIRSNITKENMDLLQRNGFTRFLTKPLKPWDLIAPPEPVQDNVQKSTPAPTSPAVINKLKEKNLKILLVDDSNDNLFLLKEVVNPLASTVHFAGNGLEALEKFRHNNYDAVFMDIQMPVMDGYTAIRRMREFEMGSGHKIPIYAVTAHAGLVDAQKCREAGFTDRIVKPVVRSDIYKSLSQAFSLDLSDTNEGEPESILPAKYLAKLMPTYFKTRFDDLEKLHAALANEDFAILKNFGHKIKGSSASYGFPKTADLSLKLELAASGKDSTACRELVAQLEHLVQSEHEKFKT